MASSYVGGLSGAFIPVSEDHGMIQAVQRGALTLEARSYDLCLLCRPGHDCHSRQHQQRDPRRHHCR